MQRIFVYTSSLILCLFVSMAQAQKTIKTPEIIKTPFFNGITVQADVASVATSLLSNGDTYSYEVSAQADFRHKLFPVIEIGYAGADKLTTDNIGFKTNGLFERIGLDINMISQKKDSKPTTSLFLLGFRLGMSNFNYDISNITITDEYWGGTQSVPYNNVSTTKFWYELTAGIRVEVVKDIYMGWTVRKKKLLNKDADGSVTPWYIPGFGISDNSLGFNYTIGYKLHLPAKKKPLNKETKAEIQKK